MVGAFGALTERVFKKFVAYSSINQIGFLLIGLSTGHVNGLQTVLLFFLLYILTTVALFTIFLNLENVITGDNLRYISELGFLSPQQWLPRVALSVVFFSLAGVPPFAGFFSKFYVLLHLFENGFFFAVTIGIITSLISAYYYLTLVNYIWFGSGNISKDFWEINGRAMPAFIANLSFSGRCVLSSILAFLSVFWYINESIATLTWQLAFSCV